MELSKSPRKYKVVSFANSASLNSAFENGIRSLRKPMLSAFKKEIIASSKNKTKKRAKGQPCVTDHVMVKRGP